MTRLDSLIKYSLTGFILIMIPTYYNNYGPNNFLWFSDIGLFLILFSLWFRSSLFISMSALITMFIEVFWIYDYFYTLITGYNPLGIAAYMFNDELSLFIRGLSLFHLVLPVLQIQYMMKWGYNTKALFYATGVFWLTLLACFNLTPVQSNINYVFSSNIKNWEFVTPYIWMSILMLSYPIIIMVPKNYCFKMIFNKKSKNKF